MAADEHVIVPATMDGRALAPDEMAAVGLQLQLGVAEGVRPRCHTCGEDAPWHCAVRLDAGNVTVGYALLYHCLAHRPTGAPLVVGGRVAQVLVPPPSSGWAVVNSIPELPPPPHLG